MQWSEIETRYPDRGGHTLDGLLTHGARTALGLAAEPRDRKDALRRISGRILDGFEHRYDYGAKGALAVLAALEGEWDLVGDCTGGALAGRVVIKKTYGDDLIGLARHVATVARNKLPATQALAAMTNARDRFRASLEPPDPRAIVLATQLFARDIVRVEDVMAATRAWLDGQALELDDARPIAAPADGEDPRVTIFERYVAELSDDEAIATQLAKHVRGNPEPWERPLETERNPLDDLVIRAYVARLPLPSRWAELVDPLVAAWLGGDPPDGTDARYRDLSLIRPAWRIRDEWEDALSALLVGDRAGFQQLVTDDKLPAFKPGRFFKDDARKLLRYLASAIAAGASEDAVEPAWLDFLARRSPATTPRLAKERVPLRWKHLLVLQAAITERLAARAPAEVGRRLQQLVTGA